MFGGSEYRLCQPHQLAAKDGVRERLCELVGRGANGHGPEVDLSKSSKPIAVPLGGNNVTRARSSGPRLVHGETAVRVILACFLRSQLRDLNSGPAVYENGPTCEFAAKTTNGEDRAATSFASFAPRGTIDVTETIAANAADSALAAYLEVLAIGLAEASAA